MLKTVPVSLQLTVAWIAILGFIVTVYFGCQAHQDATQAPTGASSSSAQSIAPRPAIGQGAPQGSSRPVSHDVRHSGTITLAAGSEIDLDSLASNWKVNRSENIAEDDLGMTSNGAELSAAAAKYFAIVDQSAPATYDTCASATGTVMSISNSSIESGLRFCVATSEGRYSYVYVAQVTLNPRTNNNASVDLSVTTWN